MSMLAIFRTIAATFVLMAAVLCVWSQTGGGFEITEAVVAGGGSSSSNGNTTVDSTTGQSVAGGAIGAGNFGLTSGFWNYIPLAPTAAQVSISGRVVNTTGGGVANAILYLQTQEGELFLARASPFGYYLFEGIQAGQTVMISVESKQYVYSPRTVTLADVITDFDFIPEQLTTAPNR